MTEDTKHPFYMTGTELFERINHWANKYKASFEPVHFEKMTHDYEERHESKGGSIQVNYWLHGLNRFEHIGRVEDAYSISNVILEKPNAFKIEIPMAGSLGVEIMKYPDSTPNITLGANANKYVKIQGGNTFGKDKNTLYVANNELSGTRDIEIAGLEIETLDDIISRAADEAGLSVISTKSYYLAEGKRGEFLISFASQKNQNLTELVRQFAARIKAQ